jgi:hypothetical protein
MPAEELSEVASRPILLNASLLWPVLERGLEEDYVELTIFLGARGEGQKAVAEFLSLVVHNCRGVLATEGGP